MQEKVLQHLLKKGDQISKQNNTYMFDFHSDVERYFEMQRVVTDEDIIPFIEANTNIVKNKRILEIGCAEAGVLKAFIDKGNVGVGVELSEGRYDLAKKFMSSELEQNTFNIYNHNIYDIEDPLKVFGELFDIIVLKDVIEHIPDQQKFIKTLPLFLKPDGVIFFAYPPWFMPFGGHQQLCVNKFLRALPWFHLLPTALYRGVLKLFNEGQPTIDELLSIKST